MSKNVKILIVVALALSVSTIIVAKRNEALPEDTNGDSNRSSNSRAPDSDPQIPAAKPQSRGPLPRLVDLGADKCIPCKKMAPILAALKKEYAGRFEVEFIDVWKDPSAGNEYGVRIIPTQIFYDASGKELFRHVGFLSREDIMATWQRFGIGME